MWVREARSLCHFAERTRQDTADVPVCREQVAVLFLVRLEYPPEPREPARDVVELTCFRSRAKDPPIVAQEEQRVPPKQGIPASDTCG